METSQLLARVIGPYMLVAGLGLFLNRAVYVRLINQMAGQELLTLTMGAFAFILGLLFVQFHNVWVMDWPVLVTLIGWLTLLKGLSALLYPNALIAFADWYKDNDTALSIQAVIAILFGLFMSYMGYFG